MCRSNDVHDGVLTAAWLALSPYSQSFLEIKESTIPDAGLGLFVSEASDGPINRGVVVTSYGGEEMAVEDASHEYAMSIPGNDDMVMVGKPWAGPVPHRWVGGCGLAASSSCGFTRGGARRLVY